MPTGLFPVGIFNFMDMVGLSSRNRAIAEHIANNVFTTTQAIPCIRKRCY